jgi:hypothetical protein
VRYVYIVFLEKNPVFAFDTADEATDYIWNCNRVARERGEPPYNYDQLYWRSIDFINDVKKEKK